MAATRAAPSSTPQRRGAGLPQGGAWVALSTSTPASSSLRFTSAGTAQWRARAVAVALAARGTTVVRQGRKKSRRVLPAKVSPMRPVPENILRPPYVGSGGPRTPDEGFPDHEFMVYLGAPVRVEVKNSKQIEKMRAAGKLARAALEVAGRMVEPGVTTEQVDAAVHDFICANNAYPSPLDYRGFPKASCTSVNDVLAHGIPDNRPLEDGDFLNVDITVYLDGYHGDTSCMFFAGRPMKSAVVLCEAARKAMHAGIRVCGPGKDFREIGKAIGEVTDAAGCYCSPENVGHGIGTYFHGGPEIIPCMNDKDQGLMRPGMTFTIEPLLVENNDTTQVTLDDKWTMKTTTGARSAQFEHTILITETGHEVLTGPTIKYKALAKEKLVASKGKMEARGGRRRKPPTGF